MNKETLKANTRLAQEAWDHLRKTGVKSTSENNDGYCACTYSGSGCAFRPALKNKAVESGDVENGMTAFTIIEQKHKALKKWAVNCDPKFARNVQIAHDGALNSGFLLSFAARLYRECEKSRVPQPIGLSEYLDENA